ncbi:glycosyl hydrolase family 17 protein [Polaribacter sp.]|nr:glycosyl hydrolase family 17 protein [Polaribacter sp.]
MSIALVVLVFSLSCTTSVPENVIVKKTSKTAAQLLGNPNYLAMSYGGYRENSREIQPTIAALKEDLKILFAMGVKIIRTYNVQTQFPHAANVLKAISELKKEDPNFEMYVMLGAWIDCLNAWSASVPDHNKESLQNSGEIDRAVALAKQYPDIVKVIAVGNEAMVKWATSYFVQPSIILKWVNHLQKLKKEGTLCKDLWITSSDDFSSWGGGDASYHTQDLEALIHAVDYVSMHTYPYHNSHYNPSFWKTPDHLMNFSENEKVDAAMMRALNFAKNQYYAVSNYMKSLGIEKPIHIGETGWATISNGHYGVNGSRATDEYKQGLYYKALRTWTNKEGISCFFFEAFDEPWKDPNNVSGSENNFGLITRDGAVKYGLWDLVDKDVSKGLSRNGNPITKTFKGDKKELMNTVLVPNTAYKR